jgi:hypothetical protein
LHQFFEVLAVHVIAKHAVEIGDQMRQIAGLEQVERAAVDLQHFDARRAFGHAGGLFVQPGAQITHSLGPPLFEQLMQGAEILDPE